MQLHCPNLGLLTFHLSKADTNTLGTFIIIDIEKPEPPLPKSLRNRLTFRNRYHQNTLFQKLRILCSLSIDIKVLSCGMF